ncbi:MULTISPECIES: Hsp20/alpha crystallin family protein [unclassified Nostoc]|uniref:Hsp20/alpha crystallin family protein n=1 Tax=unclassified Nostoc TaxID=2593658 RepID=UPI0013D30F7E|nr:MULTISPECIES: Hsp20/alpha crystallin family protein [unclassified Nostoc]MBE8998885.1 Hsp20 family protein [Nostoc sp. LEGE 12447]NEU83390.1 Hsp20 family protein [Nostoc sp. UIC 10630]
MLFRYNSAQDFNTLESYINGLLGDTKVPSAQFEKGSVKVPAAELQETDDAIYLKLELPGLEAKDLDIQVTEDTVHISGERKSETKTQNNGTTKSEFYYGKFQRVIPLSARVQNTNVTADYKNGILNLTLPKSEREKNKVVKVNLEQAAV